MILSPDKPDHAASGTAAGDEALSLVTVYQGAGDQLESCSLVLSALGIDHVVAEKQGRILVAHIDEQPARHHIELYLQENRDWPPQDESFPISLHPDRPPTLLMISLLILLFWHTGSWQEGSIWFRNGAVDSTAILEQDQWWRLVTALTLHADLVHLAGNCIIGGLMVHLLSRTIGYGLAWFLLILTGMLGNFCNIVLRPLEHHSVGFSTAVFAAIGILTGLRLARRGSGLVKGLLAPLGAGAGLLAFLGAEGTRTDLGAHLFGFTCGIGAGLLIRAAGLVEDGRHPGYQRFLMLLTLAFLFLCWAIALRPERTLTP